MRSILITVIASSVLALTSHASEIDLSAPVLSDRAAGMEEDSQIIIIVNPTPEQVAAADAQNLSPESIAETPAEELQAMIDAQEPGSGEAPTFDVPVILNERVETYIRYFTGRIRDKFELWLARSERYLPMIKKTFREKGLPEDLAYIALIESGYNNIAYSRARAVGQWQFIQGTGKRYGLTINRWVDERRDPEKAAMAAADYLSDLYGMFNDWYLAAAGYNAGEGKITRAISRYDTTDFWQLSHKKNKYLKRETKDYVPKFIAAAMIAKEPEKFGFEGIEYFEPLEYETVTVDGMKDLRKIAKESGFDVAELRAMNPELKTYYTPPMEEEYLLKVPVEWKEQIEAILPSIKNTPESVALKEVGPEKKHVKKRRGSKKANSTKTKS